MSGERPVFMPPKDFTSFQGFLEQAGSVKEPRVFEIQDNDYLWYDPDIENREMAVRALARASILIHLGYGGRDGSDEENIAESLDAEQDIKDLLGTPNFYNYKWGNVTVTDYGPISELSRSGYAIIDGEKGVVLFADEVKNLFEGGSVTTFHRSGIDLGLLELKDVYRVLEGNLQRIHGSIID